MVLYFRLLILRHTFCKLKMRSKSVLRPGFHDGAYHIGMAPAVVKAKRNSKEYHFYTK